MFMIITGSIFPAILRLPSKRKETIVDMNCMFSGVTDQLLSKGKEHGNEEDKSIMSLLCEYTGYHYFDVKSETHDADIHISRDELIAQNMLLLAGYEMTSSKPPFLTRLHSLKSSRLVSLTEQLNSSPPYLNTVVHETLRMHLPVSEATGVRTQDNVLPLSIWRDR
ncbi:hypothetical protein F5146DRAFT_995467 [Armillaria mellea]|nr:hypothetical protein F5146DRAFT_995467 [Armillaria mellea]